MRRPVPISSSSDEEILSKKKKKKVKSKSKKRYSSSDSEGGSRSPKKISKSKKLASKKKIKDYKKSEKKRKKKSKRYSSSDSSTCSDSDKSSSPVRKSKKRKRVKERGRKKLRISGSKRKRHRSSSSYSTCSGSTRSWDSDPNQNEKHFESSPSKEIFERKIQNDEHIESSFRQSPFCERFEDKYSDKIEGSDRKSLLNDRYGISYRQSPIKDRYESNFVQSSIEENFENRYQNNLNEKGSRRLRSIIVVKSLDDDVDNISKICDEKPSAGSDEIHDKGNVRSDFEMEKEAKEKEAVNLELILRQKALENLKKFRATRTTKVESHNDKKDETSKGENLDQSMQIAEKTLEPKSSSSVVDQSTDSKGCSDAKSSVSVVDQSTDLKGSSVVNLSGSRIFKNAVHNLPNDSSRNGTFNEDTSNTLSTLQESSTSKENQNERTVTRNASSKVNETEEAVSSSITQSAEVPKAGPQPAGGSQFEQKTFSRMRDGETVEVKYKVYIPKKTPALARRKLQR